MKSKFARTISAAAALGAPAAAAEGGGGNAGRELATLEDLASYGLTLDEFDEVKASESPIDFGGLSGGDQGQLWADAATFEYEVATSHSSNHASTSPGYHPYVVCSTQPDMSGADRADAVNAMFRDTPDVVASHVYNEGNEFHNSGDMSCGVLRAYNDTIARVFEANPDAKTYMTVNPLHPSMKMSAYTVKILRSWFNGDDLGDVYTVSTAGGMGRKTVKAMGLHMVLCPGVQYFGGVEDVPDEQIEDDVRDFVIEKGGGTAKDLSFYYHRVNGMDGEMALYTDRMREWSDAISVVANNWTKDDGSNHCLDSVIGEHMNFTVDKKNLDVSSELSFDEALELGDSLNFTMEDLETCLWYMTMSLALNPMVCTLEPRTKVKTLCIDGTSDLTKCTVVNIPPPVEDGENSGSSGRMTLGPWREIGTLVALILVSSSLGFAIF
eukprot:CAMPEP_0172529816 /NCGR_PEP_ID=MMETSP1067-20121228/3792_1 /TAXON_ID=265564 ORGANISM="Thalassiosira punctigera, Strain Tpunct2005C2" /NCGR_SAMPLE_ID=MMETSP1067 /ASSEMBLY_ACC=CAM_ASM_000444 /LENGTH=438 /DNA_ID=CAMNT_0013313941 /DNA_START=1 /DNA_END=1317 /DNA_ORIENTATION=-